MKRNNTIKAILLIAMACLAVSCGSKKESDDDTQAQETIRPGVCPSGAFISVSRFNSMYVGRSGSISFEMNHCKSAGTISCDGQSFTMHIDSKDTEALDLNECVGLGDFSCEYDTAGGAVVIVCPKGPTPNPFRSSMAWERN